MLLTRFCLAAGLLLFAVVATAQVSPTAPPALAHHQVRTIDPADTNFSDLAFLKAEIGPARVVMLGEPTHGEGNVTTAKIRLIRYLREQLGFTTLAFESGFYDLHKAQQALEAGTPTDEALNNSVFGIWTGTQEFQAVLPLVGKGGLRVAGFDPQLSGEYGGDLVDDLEAFLAPDKAAAALHYDYLAEVIGFMGEHRLLLPTTTLADFEREMAKATRVVEQAAATPARRAEAAFWQQCLRSLLAQARDYDAHDPSVKDEKEFKAIDSNPRDAQMADNLLWYLRQHPQEKVICWGALPHLANKAEVLQNEELQLYRPMGRAVKAALGPDQVYVLGTLGGGGTYFNKTVPVPAPGTLEADLLGQGTAYSFVSLKHDAPGRVLSTYAFQYQLLTGPWSEVVDGFLFLRTVHPPHHGPLLGGALTAPSMGPAPGTTAPNPAPRKAPGTVRVSSRAAGATVRGVVLDRKSGAPVPYASVSVPSLSVGTVADGKGHFALAAYGANQLQVSSVGYATVQVAVPAAHTALTVMLTPAAYELQAVQVRGESLDPRKIMKKVLAAIPTNYEQQDYMSEVYTHRQLSNFDTLATEVEYVSQVFTPSGQRHLHGGFLMREPLQKHRIREVRVVQQSNQQFGKADLDGHGQGFYAGSADPLRTSPLFKPRTWRKFTLQLDSVREQEGGTVYLISYAAKRVNHRTTGTYLQAGYSGRFVVQQRDYAVTHYEAHWQGDTAKQNAVARKYVDRGNLISRLYSNVYTAERTDHTVDYTRAANGRYYVRRSAGQGLNAGRVLQTGKRFYTQRACEQYFTLLPPNTELLPPNPKMDQRYYGLETYQLKYTDHHPEFWQNYQRPTAASGAGVPAAGKP